MSSMCSQGGIEKGGAPTEHGPLAAATPTNRCPDAPNPSASPPLVQREPAEAALPAAIVLLPNLVDRRRRGVAVTSAAREAAVLGNYDARFEQQYGLSGPYDRDA